MRKVIMSLGVSLDGFISRKDGSVDWLSMDWEFDWMPFYNSVDTVVMGRKSWEKALELSPEKGGNPYKGKQGYVFSRTMDGTGVEGIEVVPGDPSGLIGKLKSEEGTNIWLMGGRDLITTFLVEELVDEIHLGVTPILLGTGIRLFEGFEKDIRLKLIRNESCPHKAEDNALVDLRYEVLRD